MNTTGYSRPFAECSVISVTALCSPPAPSAVSRSVTSEIASRNTWIAREAGGQRELADRRRRSPTSAASPVPTPAIPGRPGEVAGVDRFVELAAHADELLEVLDPALRLDRVLGFELGDVAGLLEHRLDRGGDARRRRVLERLHELEQLADAAERLAGDAGGGRFVERLAEGDGRALRVRGDPVHRRFADAALRRVHHAPPAHFVVGVHERAEVREQVLDLAAVVELHAADDAVRNAGAHELLFDDAALRVRPVEDRDVVEAVPLGFDEAHRLAHHVGGFVVLVLARGSG